MNQHEKEKEIIEGAEKFIDQLGQEGFYCDDSVAGEAEKFKRAQKAGLTRGKVDGTKNNCSFVLNAELRNNAIIIALIVLCRTLSSENRISSTHLSRLGCTPPVAGF